VKTLRLITTVAGIGFLTTSCYNLQPTSVAVPEPGTRIAFAINDVGRVALGGSMGPELRQVEGSFQAKDGDDYLVNVTGVELLQGGHQTWAGESVRIKSSYVSAVYEKTFSKAKTAMALGGIAIAATLLSSKGVRSFLDPTDDGRTDTLLARRGRIPPSLSPSVRLGLPPFLRSLNPPRSH
jgi:hypothetical protein